MDQWVCTFERMAERHDTLSFQHKDNPQVVLQALRFTKTQTVDCLNVDIFVGNEPLFIDKRGLGNREDFFPFMYKTMEDLLADGDLEKILAFAANTKIEDGEHGTADSDYQCGLCGRRISSDNADEAYDHFVQDHFNGHAVKSARFQ